MILEFWNSSEFFFYFCFYDDVELISVIIIYCSILYWIIVYCLLFSLTLDPHLLFKCCPCFLFSVSASQKWVFTASNCLGYISYSKHKEFCQISSGKSGNYQGIFFRHLAGNLAPKSFLVKGAILIVSVTFVLSLHLLVFSRLYSFAAISSSFIEAICLFWSSNILFTFLVHKLWVSFLLPEPECFYILCRCLSHGSYKSLLIKKGQRIKGYVNVSIIQISLILNDWIRSWFKLMLNFQA